MESTDVKSGTAVLPQEFGAGPTNPEQIAEWVYEQFKVALEQFNTSDELLQEFNRIEASARQVEQRVDHHVIIAETGQFDAVEVGIQGDVAEKNSAKNKAANVESYVKTILQRYKEEPSLISVAPDSTGGKIIRAIVDKIKDPDTEITEMTAPVIYRLIKKAANGEITNPIEALESESIRRLAYIDSGLAQNIVDVLGAVAADMGVDLEQINKMKDIVHTQKDTFKQTSNSHEERLLNYDMEMLTRYFKDAPDRERVRRLYIKDEFLEWVRENYATSIYEALDLQERQTHGLDPSNPDGIISYYKKLKERDFDGNRDLESKFKAQIRIASSKIQNEILYPFTAFFQSVTKQHNTKFFDESIQEGWHESPESMYQRLFLNMNDMFNRCVDELQDLVFYIPAYERGTDVSIRKGKKGDTPSDYIFESTLANKEKEVDLYDFVAGARTQVESYKRITGYLHNVRALYHKTGKSPEEGGWWGQMVEFSQGLLTSDIDTLYRMPNNNMIQRATQLYMQHLSSYMMQNNWVGRPELFTRDPQNNRNSMEEGVHRQLSVMFSDVAEHELDIATHMGVNIAKAIFYSEPEMVAWGQPNLDISLESPKATGSTIHTADWVILRALNPEHLSVLDLKSWGFNSLLTVPVQNPNPKKKWFWTHEPLMRRMKHKREAIHNGREGIDGYEDYGDLYNTLTLDDTLCNMTGAAGPWSRSGGWRIERSYEQFLVKREHGKSHSQEEWRLDDPDKIYDVGKLDVLATWQNLEPLGFEVLHSFVQTRLQGKDKKFLFGKDKKGERDRLFDHLFETYIKPQMSGHGDMTLDGYIKLMETGSEGELTGIQHKKDGHVISAADAVDQAIRTGEITIHDGMTREQYIEMEINTRLLNRAMIGILAQQIPTKFAYLERSAFTPDGNTAFKFLFTQIKDKYSSDTLRDTLQDMSLIETMLTEEKQLRMREIAHSKVGREKADYWKGEDFSTFNVNEESIRRMFQKLKDKDEKTGNKNRKLREYQKDIDDRQSRVLEVYNLLKENYLTNDYQQYTFAQRLRRVGVRGDVQHQSDFRFAIASEQVAHEFLAYASAGEEMLWRTTVDIRDADVIVNQGFKELYGVLKNVAHSGDMKPLIELLGKVSRGASDIGGAPLSNQLVYQFAAVAINFFKKDWQSRHLWSHALSVGKKNSLAAELLGSMRNIHEWDVAAMNRFIEELEVNGLLSKDGRNFNKPEEREWHSIKIPFTNINTPFKYSTMKRDYWFCTKQLKQNFGVSWRSIAWEYINKVLPIVLAGSAALIAFKAFQEQTGKKRGH